jgi:hypothetical protein
MKLIIGPVILLTFGQLATAGDNSVYALCAQERQDLAKLTSPGCADVAKAAKCCAGEQSRSECFIQPMTADGSGGIHAQAGALRTGADGTLQQIGQNNTICDDQLAKIQCANPKLINAYKSVSGALSSCLETHVQELQLASQQAASAEDASESAPVPVPAPVGETASVRAPQAPPQFTAPGGGSGIIQGISY